MARRSLPNRSISQEATPKTPATRLNRGIDAGTGGASLRVQLREESGPRRGQLTFRLEHPLRGDANVVIRLQRFVDEAAKHVVLEKIEPLHIAQRGWSGLGFAGAELRGRRYVGALVVGAHQCSPSGRR